MPRLLLIRHALPSVGETVPNREWQLSDDGIAAARAMGDDLTKAGLIPTAVVASAEPKAIATAQHAWGSATVRVDERFGEAARPWEGGNEDYKAKAVAYLEGAHTPGWEPPAAVIERFGAAVADLRGEELAAVTSHGLALSLWLASQLQAFDQVAFWRSLTLPDAWVFDVGDRRIARAIQFT